MKLVIVESPSKAKTIKKYLGKGYTVKASVGHIRDLPKSSKNAIDIDAGFVPNYEISPAKKKVVSELVAAAEKADEVLLAPDPDREGEAIAWHLETILKKDKKVKASIKRITFNEITEDAVQEAIKHPRKVDTSLRQAQEARRVLDRLVGYDLSGLIWKKVRYGLSAGRVQSPALRIIMEREREIRAFDPETYYVLSGLFSKSGDKQQFTLKCDEEPTEEKEAKRIAKAAEKVNWSVVAVKETEAKRNPKAPFTTSTLQQTASTRLGFSPSRTMRAAQKLYEAGHITYMRTDSTTLSKLALGMTSKFITKEYGQDYLETRQYATKSKNAQEAHEAVRPTKISVMKAGANGDEAALYQLIWQRTVASQMVPAKLLKTKLSANVADNSIPNFSVNGSRVIFDGWLKADPGARGEDTEVPAVTEGDALTLHELETEEKQTQPPHRYSEAGLIKELEKRGIGRPSTYASIMRTLIDRGYVNKEGRTLFPTDTGDVVSSFLEEHFMDYIDDGFTAEMEDTLDAVAAGEAEYEKTVSDVYKPLHKAIVAKEDIPKVTNLGEADAKFKCPTCGKSMVIKLGRAGKFLSCSDYPDCEGALTLEGKEIGNEEPIGKHPETGEDIYLLEGRFGPYVQLGATPPTKDPETGKKLKNVPKPRRASVPKDIKPEDVTIAVATKLLMLPRDLGPHPDDGESVIANTGRFGPYVGHHREFRSLKGDDNPYTVTLERALELLKQPKALPKGVELVKNLGKHPRTGKDVRLLKSKSGHYLQKGMKRLYLDDDQVKGLDLEKALAIISSS